MIDVSLSLALERDEPLHVPPTIQTSCASIVMQLRRREPEALAIGVTSARTREGRSTIAAGLVIAQATSVGRRSVLLDLDPDHPRPPAEVLQTDQAVSVEGRIDWVLPELGVLAVHPWLNARGSLTRAAAQDVMDQLRALDVAVVADLPAVPPAGTADRFADLFDVVLLVVRSGLTPLDEVKRASDALPEPPLVVLNGTKSAIPRWLRGEGRR